MSSTQVVFLTLVEEVAPLIAAFAEEFGVHFIACRFPPFQATRIERSAVQDALHDPSVCDLLLTLKPSIIPFGGKDQLELQRSNPNFASLQLGRRSPRGLEESWFSAKTSDSLPDSEALAVWKKLAQRIKKITTAGMTVENPNLGIRGPGRNHRYTAGAKRLHEEGVPLLTINNMLLHPGMEGGDR